jgi:hypothetical protein
MRLVTMKLAVAALAATAFFAAQPAMAVYYEVWIRTTDDISGAGTDSNIYLQLFGTKGQSEVFRLNGRIDGDAFEEGDLDIVKLTPSKPNGDIGAIQKVIVQSDGKYSGSDWHLQDIKVLRIPSNTVRDKLSAASLSNPFNIPGLGKGPTRSALEEEYVKNGTILRSTFNHNGWVTGNEKVGGSRPGIELTRVEPAAVPAGGPNTSPARIYVVYYADALESKQKVDRPWTSRITLTRSMTVEDTTSNRVKIGTYVEYGYSPPEDTGGNSVKAGLTAEYEHVRKSLNATTDTTSKTVERSETFSADPGTLEFRVLVGSGTVETRAYRSTLSGQPFTATLASSDADLNPQQATFTKGKVNDEAWNRSVARAYRLAKGEANYDAMVRRLKQMGCLKNPLTAQQAIAK